MKNKTNQEKTFLCKEGDEEFTIKARSLKEAKESASIYNAVVIKEIKDK